MPALAILLAILTWPVTSITPVTGLDPSWQIGMHEAAARGLDFGSDIGFTFGPLGYLVIPQAVTGWTGVLSLAATFAVRVVTAWLLLAAARRALGSLVLAVPAAYVGAALLTDIPEALGTLAVLVAVLLVHAPVAGRRGEVLAVCLGVAAGALLLVKFNAGTMAVAVFGVAAAVQGVSWRRSLPRWAAGLAGTTLALWVLTGNGLQDLPRWGSWSMSFGSGYAGGLMFEQPGAAWQTALFLAGGAALLALAAWNGRGGSWPVRAAGLAVLAFGLWVAFKHGFVRHDPPHVLASFAALAVLPLAIAWRDRPTRVAAVALTVVSLVAFARTADVGVGDVLSPSGRPGALYDQAAVTVDAPRRRRHMDDARAAARAQLAVDPRIIAAIGDEGVHIAPHETSVVWAYGLTWRPMPVFQSYAAYTAALDAANRRRLEGDDAPRFVLRADVDRIDRHTQTWESPGENLALLCRYRQRILSGPWELLERVPDRCSTPRLVATAEIEAGRELTVPRSRPDEILYAELGWRMPLGERLRSALYRPSTLPYVRLVGEGLDLTPQLPADLFGGPLVLRAPITPTTPPLLARYLRVERWTWGTPSRLTARYLAVTQRP
jgi:hypothetical protein